MRQGAEFMAAHRACWELLPWLVNGRLSSQEALSVESHLACCEECREELRVQQQVHEHVSRKDALVLAPQASLQKLLARLDGDELANASLHPPVDEPRRQAAVGLQQQAGDDNDAPPKIAPLVAAAAPSRSPRWLMYAITAQGLLIAVLFGALWWQVGTSITEPRFATLTSAPDVIPQDPAIRVVFATHVQMREVNELLQSLNAQVIAGPGQAGVYTLILAPGLTPHGDVSTVLSSLRADARVVFAEPAVSGAAAR